MAAPELTYKGYTGSIEVSIEDECLHGRVLFIDDLITYEGNTIKEITAAFENATDGYIAYCTKTGKPANKPYSGTFNVRIGPLRHRVLAELAHRQEMSINEVLCSAIDMLQEMPTKPTVWVTPAVEIGSAKIYKIQSQNLLSKKQSVSATTSEHFGFGINSITQGTC